MGKRGKGLAHLLLRQGNTPQVVLDAARYRMLVSLEEHATVLAHETTNDMVKA